MLVVGTGKTQTSPENNLNYTGTCTIHIHVHIYKYKVVAELYVCTYVYIVHVVAQLYGLCKGFSGSIVICLYTSVSELHTSWRNKCVWCQEVWEAVWSSCSH